MSALTGNNVKDTYQGLLKLANSQTGVTTALQYVQDGLGNNIPLQVSDSSINLTGSIYFNNVLFTGTTNGSSGTSGTSGINGSSGTSGTSGQAGSSGTSGTSGSSGSSGTSGTSGSSGSSGTSGSSGSSGTSGIAGSSGTSGTSGSSGSSGTAGTSGSSGSSGTSGSSGSSGTSGIDGSSGTSGTSGSSGSSGTAGTSGTSGTSGDSIFAQTGSFWATTNNIQITGSLILSSSAATELQVIGGSQITGSLDVSGSQSITNALKMFASASYANSTVQPSAYVTESAPVSQSNVYFSQAAGVGQVALGANLTGSIVVSGSNNIFFQSNRANSLVTTGTYGYVGGNNNLIQIVPTLTTSSVALPAMGGNYFQSIVALGFTSSSLSTPNFSNNNVLAAVTINHQSGSGVFSSNIFLGSTTSTQNVTPGKTSQTISNNIILGNGLTLTHTSSSIAYQQNIGGGFTVRNEVSSSFSAATNGISLTNNFVQGTGLVLFASGSASSAQTRNFSQNWIGGQNSTVSSSYVNSNNAVLTNTLIFGQGLIVSASSTTAAGQGGSVFVGRFNDTGSLAFSQANVFAVGTGTNDANRRTGFWIDNNSNTNVSGTFNVTGSASITGSLTVNGVAVQSVDTGAFIQTGSVSQTQTILGTLNINGTGSINGVTIKSGSNQSTAVGNQSLQNVTEQDNTAFGFRSLRQLTIGRRNTAVGTGAGQNLLSGSDNQFFGNDAGWQLPSGSDNVFFGTFAGNSTISGSQNVMVGNSAGNQFVSGNNNLFMHEANNNYTGGSRSVIIGIKNHSFVGSDATGDDLFAIGSPGGGPVLIKKGVGPASNFGHALRIPSELVVSQSVYISGSQHYIVGPVNITGSLVASGSVHNFIGPVNVTGSMNMSGSLTITSSSGDFYIYGHKMFNSAEFWSTQTQSGSAGVSGSITFNTSGSAYGVSLANNSQLTVANAGTYNIQFSAQVETSAGADTAYIWFKKNGNNIADSATKVVLANNTAQVMTVNILDDASANDYYELGYQFTNGNATILSEAATGNIPAIPSVIATVTQAR